MGVIASILGAVILPSIAAPARPATLTLLGGFPGEFVDGFAFDVSADGSTVVGSTSSGFVKQAFRWTASEGMQAIDTPGLANESRAAAISADGSTLVGVRSTAIGPQGFLWTESGGMRPLQGLSGEFVNGASDVSADGSVVVGSDPQAYSWTESGGFQYPAGPFGYTFEVASGVSSRGDVIVGFGETRVGSRYRTEAIRWSAIEGAQALGDLPGGSFESKAFAVSEDGKTVVGHGVSELGHEAFRWTEIDGMQGLGHLPGAYPFTEAHAVSAVGTTIVGTSGGRAFVWDTINGMRDLGIVLTELGVDLDGLTLIDAYGVSADGQTIVGIAQGTFPPSQPFVAVLPEPGGASPLATGVLVIALARPCLESRRRERGAS